MNLYCQIPHPHQQQQQQQLRHQSPPPPPPAVAQFFGGPLYPSSLRATAAALPCAGQTQIRVQVSPQHQQQYYFRPDLGYESDRDSQQHQHQQHHQLQHQPQPQHKHHHQQQQQQQQAATYQLLAVRQAQTSPGGSTCDSARAESPADAQLAEVTSDLAGFSLTGPRPVDMALSQKMELVWHQRFFEFFSRFPDTWHLMPVFDPPDTANTGLARSEWRYFKDQAKVRFICNSCQKAWTSMGGQVVFWIFKDRATNTGYVHFKLYGQKCSDCCPNYYEHAIWYQEEVEKVVENLFHHVGQLLYGYQPQRRRVDRRAGQPRREHNTATCQACQENVCRMGQVLRKKMRTEA